MMSSTRMFQTVFLRQGRSLQTPFRNFSSECTPAQKLKEVFEDYRKAHFSRETPSRFRKELVKSITTENVVAKDGLNRVLINIGRQDRMLSDEEYSVLCREAGDGNSLSTQNMLKLFQ